MRYLCPSSQDAATTPRTARKNDVSLPQRIKPYVHRFFFMYFITRKANLFVIHKTSLSWINHTAENSLMYLSMRGHPPSLHIAKCSSTDLPNRAAICVWTNTDFAIGYACLAVEGKFYHKLEHKQEPPRVLRSTDQEQPFPCHFHGHCQGNSGMNSSVCQVPLQKASKTQQHADLCYYMWLYEDCSSGDNN